MGENIRKYIYETKSLYKLVDFTTNQVFEDAATYTCLLFLSKRKNKHFLYKRFKLGDNFKDLQKIEFENKDIAMLKENKWNFSDDIIQEVLSKIFSQKNSFPDITKKIFKGSSTGDDEIFLLDPIKEEKNTFTVFSKKLNQNVNIEKSLLRPFVYGEDIRRYAPLRSRKLLLFPYNIKGNEAELIPVEQMKKDYPLAYEYLSKLKGDLIKRKIETNSSNFYKYSAARSLVEYNQPKIMIPDMLISNRISYDKQGTIFHGPAIHSIVFNERIKDQNPVFYLAILNSKLFWFFISNTSTALRGNAYRLTPEFLNPFCFPKLNLTKSSDKQSYDKLVSLADKMLSLNKRLHELGDKKTDERVRIEEEIKKTDVEIDELVYKLYDLTDKEKKIIEENLK
jgi:adenine-specific DNA-methyltransferase